MSHLCILIACLTAGLGNSNAADENKLSIETMKNSEVQSILDDGISHLNKIEQRHGSTRQAQKTRIG